MNLLSVPKTTRIAIENLEDNKCEVNRTTTPLQRLSEI